MRPLPASRGVLFLASLVLATLSLARSTFAQTRTILAIIGDGVDLQHEDLVNKALRDGSGVIIEKDFIDNTLPASPAAGAWRATALAGIAAADTNNAKGISGVCADCRILNIRADTTSSAKIKEAIEYAVTTIKTRISAEQGSLTPPAEGVILIAYEQNLGQDALLEALLKDLFLQQGLAANTSLLVVAPAGNGEPLGEGISYPTDSPSYPCASQDATTTDKLVFCVGSVDTQVATQDQRSVFSNYGSWVDLFAPGQWILATFPRDAEHPTGDYRYINDTGAATAIVAGVAGLNYDASNTLSPLTAQEALRFTASQTQPTLDDPNLRPKLFEPVLNAGSSTSVASGTDPGPIAQLKVPTQNAPLVPGESVMIRGIAVGDQGYTMTLFRTDCCPLSQTQVATLYQQATSVNKRRPNDPLLPSPWIVSSTLAEGDYAIRLEVRKTTFSPAIDVTRVFIEKSYDLSFNAGQPLLLNDVILNGFNLADLNSDTKPELVVGSAQQRKVYAFSGSGTKVFESPQASGRIFGTPAVGNIDSDSALELVATTDVSGAPSLYAWDLPTTGIIGTNVPGFPLQIGPSKSSPVLAKAKPENATHDIFLTTKVNKLLWYTGTGLKKGEASLTQPKSFCQNVAYACNGKPLMESTPVVAGLKSTTPVRVFVPSQDALTTYGFKPLDTGLQLLPGFPMSWFSATQPASGGMFDASVAFFDNAGALHMFITQYLRDSNTCGSLDCQDSTRLYLMEVQGATTIEPTDPRKKPTKDPALKPVSAFPPESQPGMVELFMYSGTAAGDLRRGDNGEYETVIVGMSGKVYAFDSDLNPLQPTVASCPDGGSPGWPQQMSGRGAGTPLITDLDKDGQVEAITTSNDNLLYAWDANGCLKRKLADGRYGFPRALKSSACATPQPDESPLRNWAKADIVRCAAPATGDLDGDARNELVAVAANSSLSTNAIYVWDFGQPVVAAKPSVFERLLAFVQGEPVEATTPAPVSAWPTKHGNPGNTGAARQVPITGTVTDANVSSGTPGVLVPHLPITVERFVDWLGAVRAVCQTSTSSVYYQWSSGQYECGVNPGTQYTVRTGSLSVGFLEDRTTSEGSNASMWVEPRAFGTQSVTIGPLDHNSTGEVVNFNLTRRTATLSLSAQLADGSPLSSIGATLTPQQNGWVFKWTPPFSFVSGVGASQSVSITFTVSDGTNTNSATITLTVNNDEDQDTFSDLAEQVMGTDPLAGCPTQQSPPHDAWPPDFNADREVDTVDLWKMAFGYGKLLFNGSDPYVASRPDLNGNGRLDGNDLTLFWQRYGQLCAPRAWPCSPCGCASPRGDVTCDGFVSYNDYHLAVYWYYKGIWPDYPVETWFQWPTSSCPAAEQPGRADITGNGSVDFYDLYGLQEFVHRKDTSFFSCP